MSDNPVEKDGLSTLENLSRQLQTVTWQTAAKYALIGTTAAGVTYFVGRHFLHGDKSAGLGMGKDGKICLAKDLPLPRPGPLDKTGMPTTSARKETQTVQTLADGEATVKQLCLYPIKSCRAIMLDSFHCGSTGPEMRTDFGVLRDRSYMVVNAKYAFITQRMKPSMALIVPSVIGPNLEINAPDMPTLRIPLSPDCTNLPKFDTAVHGAEIVGVDMGDEISKWFADYLKMPGARLLYHPEDFGGRDLTTAAEGIESWEKGDKCAFADGAPYLLLGQESVEELNSRLDEPITYKHFRPNILVTGCAPYSEDAWKSFSIGTAEFRKASPCTRCVMTTVDPQTGTFARKDVLQTLKSYRVNQSPEWESLLQKSPMMAINLGIDVAGDIYVGDAIRHKV